MSGGAIGSTERRRVSLQEDQQKRYGKDYFQAYYHNDDRRERMYVQERARIEEVASGGKILDVGCGLGSFLEGFSSERWEPYGTDISPVAVEAAREKGIKVKEGDAAYDYPDDFFDVIVYRGSLQLLPEPFHLVRRTIELLAPGGLLVFLSTPNSNSPYYRRFRTLPFLTPAGNYLIPSDIMVTNLLHNYGLDVINVHYPYMDSPYSRPVMDHLLYLLSFVGVRRKFAFWRSAMEVYARKPSSGTAP